MYDSFTKFNLLEELCECIYLFLDITTYDSLANFQFARRIMFMILIFFLEKKYIFIR